MTPTNAGMGDQPRPPLLRREDPPRRAIELQLQAEGRDESHLVDPMPKTLRAHGEVALLLSSAPGPQDVDVVLSWVDSAGVPGNWLGSVRRF